MVPTSQIFCHFTVHLVFFETMLITKDNSLLITSTYGHCSFSNYNRQHLVVYLENFDSIILAFRMNSFQCWFDCPNQISNKHSWKILLRNGKNSDIYLRSGSFFYFLHFAVAVLAGLEYTATVLESSNFQWGNVRWCTSRFGLQYIRHKRDKNKEYTCVRNLLTYALT